MPVLFSFLMIIIKSKEYCVNKDSFSLYPFPAPLFSTLKPKQMVRVVHGWVGPTTLLLLTHVLFSLSPCLPAFPSVTTLLGMQPKMLDFYYTFSLSLSLSLPPALCPLSKTHLEVWTKNVSVSFVCYAQQRLTLTQPVKNSSASFFAFPTTAAGSLFNRNLLFSLLTAEMFLVLIVM